MSQELEKIRRERRILQKALNLKPLKGSVVMELVKCSKPRCSRCPHGPYAYLHYYDLASGKVKRRYLGRAVQKGLKLSRKELTRRIQKLSELEKQVLGQEGEVEPLTQGGAALKPRDRGPARCSDPLRLGCRESPSLTIVLDGRSWPVCQRCWRLILEEEYTW